MSTVSDQYIGYFPDYTHNLSRQFAENNTRRNPFPSIQLFLAHYRTFPCVLKFTVGKFSDPYHNASILQYLHDQFNHEPKNDIVVQKFHQKLKQFYATYVSLKRNIEVLSFLHLVFVFATFKMVS